MKQQAPLLRRMARALVAHAAAVLPASRSPWAQAMRHELEHIEADGNALTWAAGCVLASYVERSRLNRLLDRWYVRALLAVLIFSQVLSMLFATVLTAAYRLNALGLAAFLGGFTPGDDYRHLIPLMDALPWWIHALWVAASLLFFISLMLVVQRRSTAWTAFAAAWILGEAGNLLAKTVPAYPQVFSYPNPLLMRDYVIPIASALLPMLIATALWAHSRISVEDVGQI